MGWNLHDNSWKRPAQTPVLEKLSSKAFERLMGNGIHLKVGAALLLWALSHVLPSMQPSMRRSLALERCNGDVEDLLEDLVESPSGRGPKMLSDRTLSEEGRPILGVRVADEDGPKEQRPPALQPWRQNAPAQGAPTSNS